MHGSRQKCEKPPFLVILGQKGRFWTAFGQNDQSGENYQKALRTFFSHLQGLTKCKVSEKINERFPRKSVVDA